MKRRLEVCDPTWEDLQVWWWGTIAHGRKFEVTKAFFVTYVRADRRDADLMYGIEKARQWEREHPEDFAEYVGMGWVHALVSTALQGCPMGFKDLDITNFA